MSSGSENNIQTVTISARSSSSSLSSLAGIPRFRKTTVGDEENEAVAMALPSPHRAPLRVLTKDANNNQGPFSSVVASPSPREVVKRPAPLAMRSSSAGTPRRTPPKASCAIGGRTPRSSRTPNAGKILSPLPLQQRRLHVANPKKTNAIEFDVEMEGFLSPMKGRSYADDGNTGVFAVDSNRTGEDSELLDLKLSTAFDEGDNNNNNERADDDSDLDSLGWSYTLDDFRFVRKLGTGGSAEVYEALETASCTLYALKVQPASEDAMCELDLHIPLKHENVCEMIDYFYTNTKPFGDCDPETRDEASTSESPAQSTYLCTILEACNGGDLHDVIDEYVAVPEDLAAKYVLGAIDALLYLHSMDMIHCDIKPANFLLDGRGSGAVVKLADFGMAVKTDAKEVVGGSPVYMAPEHLLAWRDLTDDFDHRTDVYSLGVVLYELLMGYLPYEVLEAEPVPKYKNANEGETCGSLANELSSLALAGPENEASVLKAELKESIENGYPVLDLRKINDASSDHSFYVPPPIFVEEISDEARDLILCLMEPSVSKRITLEEARDHAWFRKFGLC